jgi:hypothetical protein
LSAQNDQAVQSCIVAGNPGCVQGLIGDAATNGEVEAALPVGYGDMAKQFGQNSVNYGSIKGQYSLFGSDVQQAVEVAAFRNANCGGMTASACDALTQQALDDRMKRVGLLTAISTVTPVLVNGVRTLAVPVSGKSTYSVQPNLVVGDEDLPNVYANQKPPSYNNSTPVQRIVFNGVELDPNLPPPVAGYQYSPDLQPRATTLNQAYSQWTGYQGEIKLANEVAGLGQKVIKWGDAVGTNGNDVISVNPSNGEVNLWDNKYRSNPTTIGQSSTFANKAPLANAVQEAVQTINASDLPEPLKASALQNLKDGNFTTNTVGSGAVKNSVQVRYCGGKPC